MRIEAKSKRRTRAAAWLIALAVSSLWASAGAADTITVTVAPEDSEIITTDLKRIRPPAPAEITFKVTTTYIEQVFGSNLATPRDLMRLTVTGSARRILGAMTGAQAVAPEALGAVMQDVDRNLADMGVKVERHTLRYVFLPGYGP